MSDLDTIKNELNGRWIVTVESCTGGLLAAKLTSIPGASSCFHHGYITYANAAKIALGVPEDLLALKGAVSPEVALSMAEHGRNTLPGPGFAIAVTGIAGPDGGSAAKPVGLVYIAINDQVKECRFTGDRDAIRAQTVGAALSWLVDLL